MPRVRVLLREGKSFALLCDHVDQNRAVEGANPGQRVDQRVEIVPVDRTDVPESEFLEEHPGNKEALQLFIHAACQTPHHTPRATGAFRKQVLHLTANPVVDRVRPHTGQILVHRPNVRRDRMVVVVQDDDQVPVRVSGVVEGLVSQATSHRPVSDDRNHAEVVAIQVSGDRRAERCRDRSRRVAGTEVIVLGLVTPEEWR